MRPHKSAKNELPYVRTKKSVLMKISDEASESKPMQVFDKVYESCGGVVGATSCGSVPRNIKQISNSKSVKKGASVVDPLFAVMEECKKEQSHANPFIRVVNAAPEPMCVLARDRQLTDMDRFCTDCDQFSIVGVDPTFNLGDFSVTVTTYRHLQLLHRLTKKNPVMLGPMLVHQNKTFESYHFLASSMVGLCPRLSSLMAFGSDGEKALGDAFSLQFRDASHLLCSLHVKERIKMKLRDLGITGEYIKLFLNDIFGLQQGSHLICGLVDSDSSEEFDEQLSNLADTWNEREMTAVTKSVPEFHTWFIKYQVSNMKSKMLKPLRKRIGLGDPPVPYTNNANESENAKIKSKVNYKKSELSVFCQKMKELVDEQTRNIERAFTMDSGPFVVSPGYVDVKENPQKWVKQSKAYKEKALNRLHKIPLLPLPKENPPTTSAPASSPPANSSENIPPLSVSWKDVGLSEVVYGGMWSKAAELVADETAITGAPGLRDSRMVISYSSPRNPHLVTMLGNGKITCNCTNYATKSLCSHVLATAQKNGVLKDLLGWHKDENKHPNLWSLARSSGVPKHPGDKPHKSKRKRSRVSLQPPKTSSKPFPPSTVGTPGNSPNPKRSSQSSDVLQADTHTNLSASFSSQRPTPVPSFESQPTSNHLHTYSPESFSSPGGSASGSEWPYPFTYGSFHPAYTSPPSWFHTPPTARYPFLPPLPSRFSPPYLGYNPEPNQSPSGSFSQPASSCSPISNVSRSPMPSPSVKGLFTLKFINCRISRCQGCKGLLRSPGTSSLPLPPHDLIVSRLECRPYMTPDKVVRVPKTASNAHYHLRMECLKAADPGFNSRCMSIPEDVKDKLSPQHEAFLSAFHSEGEF